MQRLHERPANCDKLSNSANHCIYVVHWLAHQKPIGSKSTPDLHRIVSIMTTLPNPQKPDDDNGKRVLDMCNRNGLGKKCNQSWQAPRRATRENALLAKLHQSLTLQDAIETIHLSHLPKGFRPSPHCNLGLSAELLSVNRGET